MLIFKSSIIVFSSTYLLAVCFQVTKQTNSLVTGLAFLLLASGAVATKILYDRYQQINILSSLTPDPNVTCFANKIASYSALFLLLGFLIWFLLFIFKVKNECVTAISICVCCFTTLYIWVQSIITTYISTLFYDRSLLVFRQRLVNVSFPILILLAIFGSVATLFPKGGSDEIYYCFMVTNICTNIIIAIFCIFLLTFQKEYEYFSEGLRSDLLLDDGCSLDNGSLADVDSIFGTQDLPSSAMVIKGSVTYAKVS